jgi:hypothetical protein
MGLEKKLDKYLKEFWHNPQGIPEEDELIDELKLRGTNFKCCGTCWFISVKGRDSWECMQKDNRKIAGEYLDKVVIDINPSAVCPKWKSWSS